MDLWLLAGCSCLLTLLHHPIAEALTASHSATTPLPTPQVSAKVFLISLSRSANLAPILEETPEI
ncbi:MAG: hypothetical protein SFW36_23525 [Leptolyngbyaceae cyanobacterium bins.59]|nr:hypothetical protein [Leptolyngbyaceae cyanobacterium bins.59]